ITGRRNIGIVQNVLPLRESARRAGTYLVRAKDGTRHTIGISVRRRGWANIVLVPSVSQRIAVRIATRSRQRERRAARNVVDRTTVDCWRQIAGSSRGGASGCVEIAQNLVQALAMKKIVAIQLQVLRAADACISHNCRATAHLVSCKGFATAAAA